MAKTLLERFEDKYIPEPNSGCWLWTAGLNAGGYGKLHYGSRYYGKREHLAYRIGYETLVGPVPEGMELDHKCRVRCCVNPDHLEPVTRQENVRRGIAPDRSRAYFLAITHCPKGHEYTPENAHYRLKVSGYVCRDCRQCRRDYKKRKRFECSAS